MGHISHSSIEPCAHIAIHIATEIKKIICQDIIFYEKKKEKERSYISFGRRVNDR